MCASVCAVLKPNYMSIKIDSGEVSRTNLLGIAGNKLKHCYTLSTSYLIYSDNI